VSVGSRHFVCFDITLVYRTEMGSRCLGEHYPGLPLDVVAAVSPSPASDASEELIKYFPALGETATGIVVRRS
jgi:hypothetical protein